MRIIRRIPYHSPVVGARAHLNESHLATPEAVGPLRHRVGDYASAAGIQGEQLDGVRLAVSEAVTNVVLHAYRDEPGQVHVTARMVDDELWVLIADDGVGLSAPTLRPGLGWGLAFITEASDEFTLAERAGGGAEARMVFRLPLDSAADGNLAGGDGAVGHGVIGDGVGGHTGHQ
jgi:serine/threonine-protein kinase RsbW